MSKLPSRRAFFATFGTGVWTQALTLVTGALTARLLGPEGRGQFAGAQVWPGVIAMVALIGINNSLSLRAAREPDRKGVFERKALTLGLVLSAFAVAVGWFVMPFLVPPANPELLGLSRLMLLHVPIFVLTSNLMAIDQGCGDYRQFNIARNILTPVYLLLLVGVWVTGTREVIWFLAVLLVANLAVLIYRLAVVAREPVQGEPLANADLFRAGAPFWITGIVAVLRENAERLLLMFMLGPAPLGIYVVAFAASGAHLNVSKSLNLIVFSRSAALEKQGALNDGARFFRLMGVVNLALGLAMVAVMPLFIRIIYGGKFSDSVTPAILLLVSQYFLSQGAILDEALRAQSKPYIGLGGMLAGITTFTIAGCFVARQHGLLGVACASIGGQLIYWLWMITAFRHISGSIRLYPNRSDVADLFRMARETKQSLRNRLGARASA